ncbi:MAG: universal stress protein [Dehalococcoidia bacterium]
MKIMATFDGSKFGEATLPLLERMAGLPEAEFVLISVVEEPQGQRQRSTQRRPTVAGFPGAGGSPIVIPPPLTPYAETRSQAVQRRLDETADYLRALAARLPAGPVYTIEPHVASAAAATIIERALVEQPDVIVMATHGHTGLTHLLFGDVAEQVVRSGVAPVLLVHPERGARASDPPSSAAGAPGGR